MNNAVIYARYSSDKQREQSIEGQLACCHEYAKRMGFKVINEYIDRSKSASKNVERRKAFQQMIADSSKKQFKYVIVYMVDRFARNQYDSVVTLRQLENNGVKLLSAMENLSDTDEGRLVLGFLEILAEQYSSKLAIRARDAVKASLQKGTTLGGWQLLGYKTLDKKIVIDETKAPIVRQLFKDYADGRPLKDIIEEFNAKGYTTNQGKKFRKTSFQSILSNQKYTGKHEINGETYTDRYPALVDELTFERVQRRTGLNKQKPGARKAKVSYLLSGKVRCGHCGNSMIGRSGTSRNGDKHYYYACNTRLNEKTCRKKHEPKESLEIWAVENLQKYVVANRERVAELVLQEYERTINAKTIKALEKRIKDLNGQMSEIADLMIANSRNNDLQSMLRGKADDVSLQKQQIEKELSNLRLAYAIPHSQKDIEGYLQIFAKGSPRDPEYRKRMIDKLVNVIYVYDDKILCYLNILDDRQIEFDNLPEFEEYDFEDTGGDTGAVRLLPASVSQKTQYLLGFFIFCY